MGGKSEFKNLFEAGETCAKGFPILFTRLDEGIEFLELLATNRGLRVERLQVVAEVTVNVFVVVALGELAELPAEALVAGVVLARGAPAVAAPVAETLGVGLERRATDDVDGAALAHREVVGGVKRLRGDVAPSAGETRNVGAVGRDAGGVFRDAKGLGAGNGHRVGAAEGVTVVLDKPEVVPAAKFQHGAEVKGVAQRMGDHHGLSLAGHVGGLELLGADIAGRRIVVDEDGDGAELNDRRDGGGETGGDGDDFVAVLDAFVRGELVGRQGREGDEVGGRTGVDE